MFWGRPGHVVVDILKSDKAGGEDFVSRKILRSSRKRLYEFATFWFPFRHVNGRRPANTDLSLAHFARNLDHMSQPSQRGSFNYVVNHQQPCLLVLKMMSRKPRPRSTRPPIGTAGAHSFRSAAYALCCVYLVRGSNALILAQAPSRPQHRRHRATAIPSLVRPPSTRSVPRVVRGPRDEEMRAALISPRLGQRPAANCLRP